MVPVSDPVVQTFIVHSGILALKMLSMAFLTGKQRYKKKVFANEEDAARGGKVKFDDPDVERVRRAHRNDLENIPLFWVLGALYLTTNPSASVATWLFRQFTVGRLLHTLVYAVKPLPQPSRAIAFFLANSVTFYMGYKVVSHYIFAL